MGVVRVVMARSQSRVLRIEQLGLYCSHYDMAWITESMPTIPTSAGRSHSYVRKASQKSTRYH